MYLQLIPNQCCFSFQTLLSCNDTLTANANIKKVKNLRKIYQFKTFVFRASVYHGWLGFPCANSPPSQSTQSFYLLTPGCSNLKHPTTSKQILASFCHRRQSPQTRHSLRVRASISVHYGLLELLANSDQFANYQLQFGFYLSNQIRDICKKNCS